MYVKWFTRSDVVNDFILDRKDGYDSVRSVFPSKVLISLCILYNTNKNNIVLNLYLFYILFILYYYKIF